MSDTDRDRLVPAEDLFGDTEDFGDLTREEFEAAVREASEMSQRALDRAEQVLIKAEGCASAAQDHAAAQLIAIHDRWLHFAQIVAP